MKHLITLIIALAPTLSFATVKDDLAKIDADLHKCLNAPDGQSTVGMNFCMEQGEQAADVELNIVYKGIVAGLQKKTGDQYQDSANSETLKRLIASERAWVTFRDANSTLNGVTMLGGTGETSVILGTQYDMTTKRVTEINDLLGSGN
jgi:uncharacterized protein YecT (DUF1311 family)